ncbi:hypothetical protein ACI79P_21180 [Blastococcus sp. SYSU DS0510]
MAPSKGWVIEELMLRAATSGAKVVVPAASRVCKVGSSAPKIAVKTSLTAWTRARKAAIRVPPRTPGSRIT